MNSKSKQQQNGEYLISKESIELTSMSIFISSDSVNDKES